jgi:hypothetical protein
LLAATAALAAPATPSLQGLVRVGPHCGGPQLDDAGCMQPLAGHTLRLRSVQGAWSVTAKADAAGRFRFDAPAGSYRLEAHGNDKLPRCPVLDLVLPLREPVLMDCDSGRR